MTNNVGTLMWGTGGCSLTPMPPTFLTSHYVDARLTQGKQGRRKEGKRREKNPTSGLTKTWKMERCVS